MRRTAPAVAPLLPVIGSAPNQTRPPGWTLRTVVAAVASLALLMGFAGSARATATLDLLWLDSETSVGAGTDSITLGIYVTPTDTDATATRVISMSVDYRDLTFNGATLTNIPEPGTASLLALGLGGLYAVGRRHRR